MPGFSRPSSTYSRPLDPLARRRAFRHGDVRPVAASEGKVSHAAGNRKVFSYSPLGEQSAEPHLPHYVHIDIGEFSVVAFSSWESVFGNAIPRIVEFSSKAKMAWVTATWVIARVHHDKFRRVDAMREEKRNSVGGEMPNAPSTAKRYVPVSVPVFGSGPFPAFILSAYSHGVPELLLPIERKHWHHVVSHTPSLMGFGVRVARRLNTLCDSFDFTRSEVCHSF